MEVNYLPCHTHVVGEFFLFQFQPLPTVRNRCRATDSGCLFPTIRDNRLLCHLVTNVCTQFTKSAVSLRVADFFQQIVSEHAVPFFCVWEGRLFVSGC